jgi:hypothetical protein
VINLILSQMNYKRLSTNPAAPSVDRDQLYIDINRLLEGPYNFEIKEDGRIFIKSLNRYYSDHSKVEVKLIDDNGLVIQTFESLTQCAETLGFSRYKATDLFRKEKFFFQFNGKKVQLKSSFSLGVSTLQLFID